MPATSRPRSLAPRRYVGRRLRRVVATIAASAALLGAVAVFSSIANASEASTPTEPASTTRCASGDLGAVCLSTIATTDGFLAPMLTVTNTSGEEIRVKAALQSIDNDGTHRGRVDYGTEWVVGVSQPVNIVYPNIATDLGCIRVVLLVRASHATASYTTPPICTEALPGAGSV